MNKPSCASVLKIVPDYRDLSNLTRSHQAIGWRVVLTIGSWDLLHIGHVRYLTEAKQQGDILVVGVDSDRAMRVYKGEDRPIIPEVERTEMLSYLSIVDFITLVDDVNENGTWQYGLLKKIQPDVFVAVEDSYPERQLAVIRKNCRQLLVLPRQAETSTSSKIDETVKRRIRVILDTLGGGK